MYGASQTQWVQPFRRKTQRRESWNGLSQCRKIGKCRSGRGKSGVCGHEREQTLAALVWMVRLIMPTQVGPMILIREKLMR